MDRAEDRTIDFVNIDGDRDFFNTKEQVRIKNIAWFVDTTPASRLSGSNAATGFFSTGPPKRDPQTSVSYNSLTGSSAVFDSSGSPRVIIVDGPNVHTGSAVDGYRNGVEITEDKHWTAGLAKITAGTPGHLYKSSLFGVNELNIISDNEFVEIDPFDPVAFIRIQINGGSPESFLTFPIITSDSNQLENYILNGIIEPFPIRSVVSFYSINMPFEPRSVNGSVGNGNIDHKRAADTVLSVDYFEPTRVNKSVFLDSVDLLGIANDENDITVSFGPAMGFFSTGENTVPPFEDVVYPRGEIPSSSYSNDLLSAVYAMKPLGQTYVSRKERSAPTGFMYDRPGPSGTDSIAYGGMLH